MHYAVCVNVLFVQIVYAIYVNMNKLSYRVALGGVISSLCILAMFTAGIAPFLYLTLPMIAGVLIAVIVVEVNTSWAVLTYVAVSLLSLFVTFDKEAAIIFILFFGHYPIVKQKLDKIHIGLLKFLTKQVIFNICIVAYYYIIMILLGIDFSKDFSSLGKYGIYIIWFFVNIFFIIYDYALSGCILMYIKSLKPKIYGNKKR